MDDCIGNSFSLTHRSKTSPNKRAGSWSCDSMMRPWCKLRNRYKWVHSDIQIHLVLQGIFKTNRESCRKLMPLGEIATWSLRESNPSILGLQKKMPFPEIHPILMYPNWCPIHVWSHDIYIYNIYIYMIPIHMDFLCIYLHSTLENRKRVQSPWYTPTGCLYMPSCAPPPNLDHQGGYLWSIW